MALWHFGFWLVPRRPLVEEYGAIPSSLTASELDGLISWADASRSELEACIATLLPPEGSHAAATRLWGTPDGHRFELVHDERRMRVELRGRIDLRSSDVPFLDRVVQLAITLDAVLVTADLDVVEPSLADLAESVSESHAFAFVSNPRGLLERLARSPKPSRETPT